MKATKHCSALYRQCTKPRVEQGERLLVMRGEGSKIDHSDLTVSSLDSLAEQLCKVLQEKVIRSMRSRVNKYDTRSHMTWPHLHIKLIRHAAQ